MWEPLRAAEPGRRQTTPTPWAEAPQARSCPDGSHPRLSPLPAQKARLLAKALVPIQHQLPPGHRAAGTSGGFRAGPARRPSVAPLGLHHPGASPIWARARPGPPLTMGVTWRLPWGLARAGAVSDVSGGRARLARSLALRHLLGSQTSSRLQRSPRENKVFSGLWRPGVCLLGQGSGSGSLRGCPGLHPLSTQTTTPGFSGPVSLGPAPQEQRLAGRLPIPRDRDPEVWCPLSC